MSPIPVRVGILAQLALAADTALPPHRKWSHPIRTATPGFSLPSGKQKKPHSQQGTYLNPLAHGLVLLDFNPIQEPRNHLAL